jgi:hypothetical protein
MRVQDYFEECFSSETGHLPEDRARAQFIRTHIPSDVHSICEVGCGSGVVTTQLKDKYQVTGLELSAAGAAKVRQMGVSCVQGSIEALPFKDREFDLVLASEVIEHLDQRILPKGLSELARVASKYILLTVPNRDHFRFLRRECPHCKTQSVPWGHVNSFGPGLLKELFADFSPREIIAFGPKIPNAFNPLTRLLFWTRWLGNPLDKGMVCPVCGYRETRDTQRSRLNPLRLSQALACRLSPACPRWILALYQRKAAQTQTSTSQSR